VEPRIYILPGRNDTAVNATNRCTIKDLALFNILNFNWERVQVEGNFPVGRWGATATTFGNEIIYLGGMNLSKYLPMELNIMQTN